MRLLPIAFAAALALTGAHAEPAPLQSPRLSAWVQYNSDGVAEARAVVNNTICPSLWADGVTYPMQTRVPGNETFPTVCAAPVPKETSALSVYYDKIGWGSDGASSAGAGAGEKTIDKPDIASLVKSLYRALPLPVTDPIRILVIGDGGCRVKGDWVQDCRDPDAWPFAKISAAAARLKPDLILHVGDYPSREGQCPEGNKVCAGQPFGDNWTVWSADLFTPMAPLLKVAPVIFTRGNHEECRRTGHGFMRLIGPYPFDPAAPCPIRQKPFSVAFDRLDIAVIDNAAVDERRSDEAMIAAMRQDLAGLAQTRAPTWLMMHRPIFGSLSGPLGIKVGGNINLIDALPKDGIASSVELMLSGHFHTFETLNYAKGDKRIPPQIIAGIGGDFLSKVPDDPAGTVFQGYSGVEVASGTAAAAHGFVLMTREKTGWRIERFDADGVLAQTCRFDQGRIACPR